MKFVLWSLSINQVDSFSIQSSIESSSSPWLDAVVQFYGSILFHCALENSSFLDLDVQIDGIEENEILQEIFSILNQNGSLIDILQDQFPRSARQTVRRFDLWSEVNPRWVGSFFVNSFPSDLIDEVEKEREWHEICLDLCRDIRLNLSEKPMCIELIDDGTKHRCRITSNQQRRIDLSKLISIYSKFDSRLIQFLRLFRIFSRVNVDRSFDRSKKKWMKNSFRFVILINLNMEPSIQLFII